MIKNLLVIEDESLLGIELKRHYVKDGWRVRLVNSLHKAQNEILEKQLFPLVVLSDLNLLDGSALDLLEKIRSEQEKSFNQKKICEWVFLTGYGKVDDSVRALRLGAYDFLEKPIDFHRLDSVIAGAERSAIAQRRPHNYVSSVNDKYSIESFRGKSEASNRLREMLRRLSRLPFSALVVTGETGTGKGAVARILHHNGPRKESPLIEINCSALPRDLMESELFGHEAGSFTGAKDRTQGLFEQADGGTLFLDEIGEMPFDLQAKLLKVLEEKSFRRIGGNQQIVVDVQVIAATNRDILEQIKKGKFREDLYHRLSVFELKLPSLRERKDDIDDLVRQFISEFNIKANKTVKYISNEAWAKLKAHNWPGNVRELRNVIERSVLFSDNEELALQFLQLKPAIKENGNIELVSDSRISNIYERQAGKAFTRESDKEYIKLVLDGSIGLDAMNKKIIYEALKKNRYNVTATALMLGTTRDTLRYRIRKYGINLDD